MPEAPTPSYQHNLDTLWLLKNRLIMAQRRYHEVEKAKAKFRQATLDLHVGMALPDYTVIGEMIDRIDQRWPDLRDCFRPFDQTDGSAYRNALLMVEAAIADPATPAFPPLDALEQINRLKRIHPKANHEALDRIRNLFQANYEAHLSQPAAHMIHQEKALMLSWTAYRFHSQLIITTDPFTGHGEYRRYRRHEYSNPLEALTLDINQPDCWKWLIADTAISKG